MPMIVSQFRRLHCARAAIGVLSVLMLSAGASTARAAPLDGPIEEIQALIVAADKYVWEAVPGPVQSDSVPPGHSFECNGHRLALKNGAFDTLETGYLNSDSRLYGSDKNQLDAKRYREELILVVTALFPDWKEGRTWLETNLNRTESGGRYVGVAKVGGAWIVVAFNDIYLSDKGGTLVFVTKHPKVVEYAHRINGLVETE